MAQPNQLNPIVKRVGVTGGSTAGGIFIAGGTSTDSASIIIELGTVGTSFDYGTIYICSTTGSVFVAMPDGGNTFYQITAS